METDIVSTDRDVFYPPGLAPSSMSGARARAANPDTFETVEFTHDDGSRRRGWRIGPAGAISTFAIVANKPAVADAIAADDAAQTAARVAREQAAALTADEDAAFARVVDGGSEARDIADTVRVLARWATESGRIPTGESRRDRA